MLAASGNAVFLSCLDPVCGYFPNFPAQNLFQSTLHRLSRCLTVHRIVNSSAIAETLLRSRSSAMKLGISL